MVNKTEKQILDSLKSLHSRFDDLNAKINNNTFKVQQMSSSLNALEQHSRASAIKILNFEVSPDISKNSVKFAKFLHSELFSPILKLAVDNGYLDSVPAPLEFVDAVHLLPSSKEGSTPAIHVRIRTKIYKEMLMRHKKLYFDSMDDSKKAPLILDSITKLNAQLLKATRDREDVLTAWFFSGAVKYKTKADPEKVCTAKIIP